VYTPDVVSVGEGPSSWTDYFSQQARWSRGTFEILGALFWRRAVRLRPGHLLHYSLILTFYPSMALGWILGALNAVLYVSLGAKGIEVPAAVWLMLYADAAAFQFALYIWNRRYNVSPHEVSGSFGLIGMLMSVLSAPIYAATLLKALTRRPTSFVVTPKGAAASADGIRTFRWHLQWAAGFLLVLAGMLIVRTAGVLTCMWSILAVLICATPIVLWRWSARLPVADSDQLCDTDLVSSAVPAERV
jgi:cellulose synthase/poly-beta-1,6-N-acetylglucosamine synthase-like glycosyltransferase